MGLRDLRGYVTHGATSVRASVAFGSCPSSPPEGRSKRAQRRLGSEEGWRARDERKRPRWRWRWEISHAGYSSEKIGGRARGPQEEEEEVQAHAAWMALMLHAWRRA